MSSSSTRVARSSSRFRNPSAFVRRIIAFMNLEAIQAALTEAALDGWLFYDHHHRDPLAAEILGLDPNSHITRRWYYFIPAAASRASSFTGSSRGV